MEKPTDASMYRYAVDWTEYGPLSSSLFYPSFLPSFFPLDGPRSPGGSAGCVCGLLSLSVSALLFPPRRKTLWLRNLPNLNGINCKERNVLNEKRREGEEEREEREGEKCFVLLCPLKKRRTNINQSIMESERIITSERILGHLQTICKNQKKKNSP